LNQDFIELENTVDIWPGYKFYTCSIFQKSYIQFIYQLRKDFTKPNTGIQFYYKDYTKNNHSCSF